MIREKVSAILELPAGASDHAQGLPSAPVTLVEYGDYECSPCGQAYAIVQDTRRRLGDRLRFVFRHFVVTGAHSHAQQAAEAAEAAGAQGKFWQMYNTLFAHQEELDNGFLVEYADALGLDIARFLRDMAGHVYASRLDEGFQSGRRSGVNRTPTFFINGLRHDADWHETALMEAVDAAGVFHSETRARMISG